MEAKRGGDRVKERCIGWVRSSALHADLLDTSDKPRR